jgi:large subunit ribosomal protein L15
MSITLQGLPKIKRNTRKRVGRGIGSSKGKTAGRGVKGQKARTGHHSVKGFEGGQTPVHMRLPKKGFKNVLRKEYEVVNIANILSFIESKKLDGSAEINKEKLVEAGLVKDKRSKVKLIMGKQEVAKKLKILVDAYSKNAKVFA